MFFKPLSISKQKTLFIDSIFQEGFDFDDVKFLNDERV